MSREWRLFIDDILRCAGKIRTWTAGLTLDEFVADERTRDAVLRNIELIGEAARHLPDDVCRSMPQIDWRNVSGMRNWLAHAYFGIDNQIVWNVIEAKVPELEGALRAYLAAHPPREPDPAG